MEAARNGRADAVQRLVDAGAKVNQLDFTGRSALVWAKDGRNSRVITVLQKAGAN
jgi:ankyrin repeat protein